MSAYDLSRALETARGLAHAELDPGPLRHTPTHPRLLALAARFQRLLGLLLRAKAEGASAQDLALLRGYIEGHLAGWPALLTGGDEAPFADHDEAARALDEARHPADDAWLVRLGQRALLPQAKDARPALPETFGLSRALRVWGSTLSEDDLTRALGAWGESAERARALRLEHGKLSVEALEGLARLPSLSSLSLHSAQLTRPMLEAMCAPGAFPALRAFHLSSPHLVPSADLAEFAGAPWIGQLHELHLYDDGHGEAELWPLLSGAVPALRALSLGGSACGAGLLGGLLERAPLEGLRDLRLHTYERGGGRVTDFLARARLPGLRWLTLNNNDLAGLGSLHHLQALRGLELSGAHYPARELGALLRALAGSLEHLDLSWGKLTPLELSLWAELDRPLALRGLELHSAQLKSPGLMALLGSPRLPHLQRLTLSSCGVGAEGLAPLEGLGPRARPLLHLNLGGNPLGPDGAAHLSRSPALEGLGELMLWGTKLGDEGLARLWEGPALAGLGALQIHQNGISAEGVGRLARCGRFRALARLVLRQNPLGADGLKSLAGAEGLEGLEQLDLSNTSGDAQGLRAVANAEVFPALHTLYLQSDKLSDAVLEVFAKKRGLPGLRWLVVPSGVAEKATGRTLGSLARLSKEHGVRVRFTPTLAVGAPW